jgi:hypothetical protein
MKAIGEIIIDRGVENYCISLEIVLKDNGLIIFPMEMDFIALMSQIVFIKVSGKMDRKKEKQ